MPDLTMGFDQALRSPECSSGVWAHGSISLFREVSRSRRGKGEDVPLRMSVETGSAVSFGQNGALELLGAQLAFSLAL